MQERTWPRRLSGAQAFNPSAAPVSGTTPGTESPRPCDVTSRAAKRGQCGGREVVTGASQCIYFIPQTNSQQTLPDGPQDRSARTGPPVTTRRRAVTFIRTMLSTPRPAPWLALGSLAAVGEGGHEHKPVAPPWPPLTGAKATDKDVRFAASGTTLLVAAALGPSVWTLQCPVLVTALGS